MAVLAPAAPAIAEAALALFNATLAVVTGLTAGAVIDEAAKAREKSKAEPTTTVKTEEQCKKDDCDEKIEKMQRILNAAAPPRMHPKGLKQRFCEQRHGELEPGSAGWYTHQAEIKKDQIRLNKVYVDALMEGCPIPPKLREEIRYYGDTTLTGEDYQPMPGFKEFCYQRALEGRSG